MAFIDCMNRLGIQLSKDDRALLQQWVDQGLTDDQVLDRYDLHIEKKLVDITKRAQAKGAKVSLKRDVLGDLRSFSEAQLAQARERLAILRDENQVLLEKVAEIDWVEGNVKHWEPGGPAIDLADDGALLVRFHQMLFPVSLRQALKSGQFGNQQIRGEDAYELRDSFRAMQKRGAAIRLNMHSQFVEEVELVDQIDLLTGGQGIALDADTGEYFMGPLPPDKPEGVSEESWSYTFSTEAPKPPFTIKTGKDAEGDLYIQRVGPNAGTPHRTRQGPSDMAISLDQSVLLPDYMFYFLKYLQPQMKARAHGTAQQAINKRDVEEVITKAFQNMAREDTGDFYTEGPEPTIKEKVEEAKANYKAIVRVVEEREIKTGITKVVTAHDAAHVLAEIRKNASEGFWGLVLDKDDNVVGVIEHGRGTFDGTSVYPSTYAGAVLTIPGAAKLWMAHNHPSGTKEASQADMRITQRIGKLLDGSDVQVLGHFIMGAQTSTFTMMDEKGNVISTDEPIRPAVRNKRVKVFTRKIVGPQKGAVVKSPAETKAILDGMGNPDGVLMLNNRHRILGFLSMTPEEMRTLKGTGQGSRLMRAFAEMNAAAFMVSTKQHQPEAANNMAAFAEASDWRMLDAFYVETNQTISMAERGQMAGQAEFYQQSNIGFTSGLLTAVQTMPREKGTAAEMLGGLRKIKKNKKGEMVTTYAAGVTKAEMDWLDVEEWAEAKGAPAAPLPSQTLRIKTPDRTTEVLQNPTDEQFRLFRQSITMEYKEKGWNLDADPLTRTTWDEAGNRFVWASTEAAHIVMEEDLARVLGVDPATLSQHNEGKKAKAGIITRQEMIDYIRANGIVVEEASAEGDQAYQGQALPGGRKPRDLFLKMPEVPEDTLLYKFDIVPSGIADTMLTDDEADNLFTWVAGEPQMNGAVVSREGQGDSVTMTAENISETQYDLLTQAMSNLNMTAANEETTDWRAVDDKQRQLLDKVPGLRENFPISYFPHKNIIAWIRTTERTGPNGEKILFIEEVQSKWHQQGAEFGYVTPEITAEIVASSTHLDALRAEKKALIKSMKGIKTEEMEDQIGEAYVAKVDEITAAEKEHGELIKARLRKVPDAPFKGRGWPRLAMKRMIRLAAEEGYDQIAWTTGEQQNIRGNLAAQAERLTYRPVDGQLFVETAAGSGLSDFTMMLDMDDADAVMGKAAAEHLRDEIQIVEDFYEIIYNEEDQMYEVWDGNAELFMTDAGEPLGESNIVDAERVLAEQLDYQGLLPSISGDQLDSMVGAKAQAMPNFYDRELVNLTNDAAKKLDKDAAVLPFGQEIFNEEGAPFTHELRRAEAPVFNAGYYGVRPRGVGWYVVDYQGRVTNGPFDEESKAKGVARQHNNVSYVHKLDITEQMRAAALEGQTLMQGKKGAISFDQARRGVIKLTEARDLSTFMHEAAHLYLEIMRHLAEQPATPQAVKDDYAKMLEYLGVGPDGVITREQHELWARSFEKYLQEGKAPSVSLQSAFNAYRRWLTEIWKRIKGDSPDGIVLTPEIRDVMDRILASNDQIAVANATQEFSAVFQTADQMGVTQREFDVYKADIVKATNEAVEKETVRLMAAQRRESLAWWKDELAKVRLTVEAEAWEMQVYKAFSLLAHGTQPNGEPLEQGSPFKIDKASLLEMLQGSKDTLKRLPKPWVYSVKNGVDVNIAAKQLGYPDGMALVKALMEMPNMKDWIDVTAKERLEVMFPDPLLDGSISENAIMAVHNEARANILVKEMRELRRLMKADRAIVRATKADIKEQDTLARLANRGILPKRDELKLIKAVARDTIAKLRVMDVRPEVYLNAERKAGRIAFEAAARGDYEKAYNAKRQQTVNHEMYRAAVRAKAQALKDRNYLAKFSKPRVQQRLGKLGVLDPILAVLEGIELKKVTLKKINERAALQKLAQQIHDGQVVTPISEFLYHVEVDDKGNETVVLNEAPFKNWQELTGDELHAMREIVQQLEHQGKRKLEMEVNGEMIVLDDAINELTEEVLEVNELVDVGVGEKGRGARTTQMAKSGFAHWLSPSVMARVLDKQGWGATTRLIIVTIRRAISEKLVPLQQKAITDVSEIYLKHYSKGRAGWNDRDMRQLKKKGFVIINGENLSKSDVLSIALQMGNEGNRSALFNGVRIDGKIAYPEDEVRAALALLDARDWAFVQDIWDYLDSYWPALSALEKERRGISPERIESVPFTVETSDGQTVTLKGGYYPLRYNYEHSERHEENIFEDHYKNMGNGIYVSASTRASATHNRTKNHNMVVQLGLFTIDRHLKEITRDIAIGNEVNFAKNLLNDKGYRRAMKQTGNATTLRELTLWLTDAAVGELPANNMVERGLAHVRIGFTMSKLAWNVYTTVLQLTGIFQSVVVIGSKNMAMGAGRVMRNPASAWAQAFDNSKFLQARYGAAKVFDPNIQDAIGVLKEYGPGLPTTSRRARRTVARSFFWPIAKMQQMVDVITWWGSIWKAQNTLGLGEHEAALYADAQVELAQTSGFFSDRSGIERGTLSATTRQNQFIRLWTTLISYMQRKGNIAYMKTAEFKDDKSFINAASLSIDMLMLFTLEGVASAMIYGRWDWDEDDPAEILLAALKETALSVAAGIPFVREAPVAAYGSGNTAVGALTNDLYTLYIQALQGEIDPALRKAFVNSMGTIFHLPASQTNRLFEALIDEDDPELLEYLTGTRD